MFCKWCGMESAATDLCSWCHRPLSATTTTPEPEQTTAEAPAHSAPAARPLVEAEPEEAVEAEEESPLAAGITPDRSARRPAPAHRPAWAPVPRAGTASSAPTVAPIAKAPEPEPTPTTSASDGGARPVIGVRRPAGSPAPATGAPAAASTAGSSAPIGVRRPAGAPVPAPAGTNRPPAPGSSRPALNTRPAAPTPVPAGARPNPVNTAVEATQEPAAPPTASGESSSGASGRTAIAVNRSGASTRSTPAPLPVEEEETGGLAAGVAAAKRPVGVPALGTFTASNSKYYTGQVVDVASGTHYDSATGQATSTTASQKPEDIVLQWDDPVSTPRQIGRFAAVCGAILLGMAGLMRLMPDYAAISLVVAMFASGVLLPVLKAVPFQSDDSDDLVWMILLTLLFGPSIGLLIYSVKAGLLRDMNLAVLGMLAVAFCGYIVFQVAAPLPPLTPDASEGFFNVLKLAPPWTQFARYGYAALLYNWVGMVVMVGWFVGNVFHKLDE